MMTYFNQIQNIKGIIQVGANLGQEVALFKNFTSNIILIEPIPQLAQHLSQSYPDCIVMPFALGSENSDMKLYLASNNGESSSLLKPTNHKIYYPDITFTQSIRVPVRTFTSLVKDYKINIDLFNILITDTQGYDLEAIKGFGLYIQKFNLIIAEYINSSLYQNNSSLKDLCEYLIPLGFELIETFSENLGAGNVVFKKDLL